MDQIRRRKITLTQWVNQVSETSPLLNEQQILELARLNPTKLEDLDAIHHLKPKFKETYGQKIIDLLNQTNQQSLNLTSNELTNVVLSELEKKLINISRRNKLLYVGKLTSTMIDVFELGLESLQQLIFEEKKIEVVNLKNDDKTKIYNTYIDLNKKNQKQIKETGQHQLYLAYPFVVGQFISDPFIIRAPLCLFPLKIDYDTNKVQLQIDQDGDTLINTNLLVASQKFQKFNKPLPAMELEEIDTTNFFRQILETYKAEGLTIDESITEFEEFTTLDEKTIKPNVFKLQNQGVIGLFSIRDSAIQRDFNQITQLSSFPEHVLTLLESMTQDLENQEIPTLSEVSFTEEDLAYINPLNTFQQQAQLQIKKGHNLVLEGPPGTGKSQTISNVIAQAIYDQKNVLMVSEKKAAIEVVYSRLAQLNTYTLIIDNLANKNSFYQQLSQLFESQIQSIDPINLQQENDAMNELLNDCDTLAQKLNYQITPSRTLTQLANEINYIDYHQPQQFESLKTIKECVNPQLLDTYDQLANYDSSQLDQQIENQKIQTQVKNLENYHLNLTDFEILTLQSELPQIEKQYHDFENSGFFNKLINKSKKMDIIKPLSKLVKNINNINFREIKSILENYSKLSSLKSVEMPLLAESIEKLNLKLNQTSQQSFTQLKNYLGFQLIDTYMANNRNLKELLQMFPSVVSSFNETAQEKAEKIQTYLTQKLQGNLTKLQQNKRSLEMKRVLERKRKWSIAKFVNHFYVELFDAVKIWLCTPDVVAEIFPLKVGLFDLLIFDEASQLYVERSIGSILRAKQLLIAGDSQQLRPSSFGMGRYGYDEDIQDEVIESTAALDEESLLDLARFKFPKVVLNFHYRSIYEELIAFSNAAFYHNRLIVAPNALKSDIAPITILKIEDGLWEDRKNVNESKRVVQLVKDISLNRKHDETIGIITFNITQRKQIEKDLEDLAKQDSSFNDFYLKETNRIENNEDKSLFVKNIENVQGDERDIIIFSITYAKDSSGKVPAFYGWLSQSGGENRLNVAISRAKRQIYVVTSIYDYELPVSEASALGPQILKQYLAYSFAISNQDYGQARLLLEKFAQFKSSPNQTPHPLCVRFEKDLTALGYEVKHHFGLSDFNLEMVILKADKPLLALEFEHSRYQNPNTRDRDIYLPNYLKIRGWKLHRVFDTSCFFDYETQLNNIVEQLKMI